MAAILKTASKSDSPDKDFMKLQSNPMFSALRATLITDVEQTTNIPVTLIKVKDEKLEQESSLDPAVVAVQEANLQSDFQQILPSGNQKVSELQMFYNEQCSVIENSRNEAIQQLKENNMLSVSQYKREMGIIHTHHDEQRMHLTNRVTASLQLLKISMPSSAEVSSSKSKSRQLNSYAVEVMTEWYDRHIDNPYPTDEEKLALADMGGLSLSQVKAWFANKRNRTNNTKPKKQKIQVEKKLLNICTELSNGQPGSTPRFYGQIIAQLSDIVNCSQVFSNPSRIIADAYNSSGDELETMYNE
ncbi:pre-B-cell leukemia transcription factor 2-like [Ruditapes philippinarum]|uniref:pre-B-cell leukemia transcription factor 2-like n=1 Tax=Ruditapes philippinarum TaxID=129788 RepID=UPI00295BA25F|nr:pre-B-cell leukemia transcription factor 2-like [Ruditapes philippinarum]